MDRLIGCHGKGNHQKGRLIVAQTERKGNLKRMTCIDDAKKAPTSQAEYIRTIKSCIFNRQTYETSST